MNTKNLIPGILLTLISACSQPEASNQKITEAIGSFVDAADQQDADKLNSILHPEFRAIANRVFGNNDVQILSKEVYLKLISDGTIGGDKRIINIEDISIQGANAMAKATFTGNDHKFITFILLAENTQGSWLIISDMASVKKLK